MSLACVEVIPTLAVLAATALFAATRASVKYSFVVPSAMSSVSKTTTPTSPFTESTGTVGILGNVCNAPVPSMYSVLAPPTESASVPEVVIGEPLIANALGTVMATDVTVPPPPPEPLAADVILP